MCKNCRYIIEPRAITSTAAASAYLHPVVVSTIVDSAVVTSVDFDVRVVTSAVVLANVR